MLGPRADHRALPAGYSVYLDLVRFAAALAVLTAHVASAPYTAGVIPTRLGIYGQTAVIAFFVLSGYVIGHGTAVRATSAATYAVNRATRLYSVVIVALPLTYLLDMVGMAIDPELYRSRGVTAAANLAPGYAAALLFLNEYRALPLGGLSPGSNGPFWSLSFEATYYALAGLVMFARPRVWLVLGALMLVLAGPTIAALGPTWFLGFALSRWQPRQTAPPVWAWLCWIATAVALAGIPELARHVPGDNFGVHLPWGRQPFNRNLMEDYLTAALCAAHLFAARLVLDTAPVPAGVARLARRLGSWTFPLYSFHYPLLCLAVACSPWPRTSPAHAALLFAATMLPALALTPVCDGLRDGLRRAVRRG